MPPADESNEHYNYTYEFDASLHGTAPPALEIRQSASGVGGVGTTVWDSGLVLSRYLERRFAERGDAWKEKKVLELGCGTGIVGLVAARLTKGEVWVTDKFVDLAVKNIELNDVKNARAVELPWGREGVDSAKTAGLPGEFDAVLLADVVHWPELFDPLIETLNLLCGQEVEILLAYEKREFDKEVEFFAKFGEKFSFRDIKEDEQHEDFKGGEDIWLFTARRKVVGK